MLMLEKALKWPHHSSFLGLEKVWAGAIRHVVLRNLPTEGFCCHSADILSLLHVNLCLASVKTLWGSNYLLQCVSDGDWLENSHCYSWMYCCSAAASAVPCIVAVQGMELPCYTSDTVPSTMQPRSQLETLNATVIQITMILMNYHFFYSALT